MTGMKHMPIAISMYHNLYDTSHKKKEPEDPETMIGIEPCILSVVQAP